MMLNLSVQNFTQIAAAGAGFELDAARLSVQELTQIAVASKPGARITIQNAAQLKLQELTQIAVAGKGSVYFEQEFLLPRGGLSAPPAPPVSGF